MEAVFQILSFALPLLGGYFAGSHFERKHFHSIRIREYRFAQMALSTMSRLPDGTDVQSAQMVTGCCVVSLDYFKRFLAGLRSIFGGRIRAYEPLLDRARREALLRMREEAHALGCDMVINVRLETSRLASGGSDGRRTTGVEILAFGTAIRRRQSPAT